MCAFSVPRAEHVVAILAVIAVNMPSDADAARRAARTPPAAAATVTVDYGVALAGIQIGTARLSGSFSGLQYQMDVSAQLTGLVGAVTGGMGSARSAGYMAAGPQPETFAISTRTANSGISVRMALARGNVVQSLVTPPLVDTGDRVPVTAADKRGVMDPASALAMPVQGHGELVDPAACNRTLSVYDGATRFNVMLSYTETRQVDKPGYSGPVLVCGARYQAVAGHRADRPGVRFMEDNRDMSVWLAPVEGTRILIPLRISVRTTIGTNIIEATRWTRTGSVSATAQPSAKAETGSVASLSSQ